MLKNFSRREIVKKLGLSGIVAGMGLKTHNAHADETDGDPEYAGFARNIRTIPPSMQDVSSAYLDSGKVVQPARELPIFHQCDVVVVGGGAAGFGAAVAAARVGAKVALVERYGSLGGLWTNGMVLIVIGTGVQESGEFKLVTRGVCEEFLRRLEGMGKGAISKLPPNVGQPTVDPEAAKVLMDDMIQEAGVDLFFHTWGVDVIQNGNALNGVVFESKQGRQAIIAKVVIDASGDGDVLFQAGENYAQITHALGFVHRLGNVDRIDKAKVPENTRLVMGSAQPTKTISWVNSLGAKGNGLDIRDLTKAELAHRKSIWNYTQRIQGTPGHEEVYLAQTTSQLGVRATRLLDGVAKIDKQSAAQLKKFPDVIAVSGHDGLRLPEFQIPYGSLLPKTAENLLVAGRCISCAPDIIDRVRLIPVCVVTGQAAGVAAALAVKNGTTPRAVPVPEIQALLRKQGAYLG